MNYNQNKIQQIALERIERLFTLAKEAFTTRPDRSHRYVQLALKISTRNRARLPATLKTQYCKKCHHYLQNGKNAEKKETLHWLEITCQDCGAQFKRQKSAL